MTRDLCRGFAGRFYIPVSPCFSIFNLYHESINRSFMFLSVYYYLLKYIVTHIYMYHKHPALASIITVFSYYNLKIAIFIMYIYKKQCGLHSQAALLHNSTYSL